MKRTQIYLALQQHNRLKSIALKQHSTVSEVIRELIDEQLMSAYKRDPKQTDYRNSGEWLLAQPAWAERTAVKDSPELATRLDEDWHGDS